MNKNTKIILAIIALVAVVGIFLGVYFITRPQAQEGEKTITVEILHSNGEVNTYVITTTATTLAEAMNEKNLLGENLDGMYNTIDGETTDYTANQSWWRLLINGQEGMEGANTLLITDGSTYRWEYKIGW